MLVLNIWAFLIFVYINILRPFNKDLKNFGMRPNFEVRHKDLKKIWDKA
jgi:hypothetical protein